MKVTKAIALDFGRDTTPITVFAKQRDKQSRFIEITPLNSGQSYELGEGITARLHLTKPDKHTVLNDAAIAGGKITVELTEQALAVAGTAVAEIGLYKGEALLSSQTFYIDIERAAYDPAAPESSDEYNALVDALGKVDGAVAATNASAKNAETATTNANTAATAANKAATAAGEATTAAKAATEKASKVNIKAEQTATGATVTVTDQDGVETAVHIDTLTAIDGWNDVKNAVRLGLGEKLFPVGYEFTTEDSVTGAVITWVVRSHNHHTAANGKLEHSMTLEMKYVYGTASGTYKAMQFDNTEALYYAAEGLSAGTYNFTLLAGYDATYGGGKTLSFTLTKPVPAGGVIMFPWGYQKQATDTKVSTYASNTATAAIESVAVVESADGTNLGTADGKTANMNHSHRIRYGSNNYAQSAIRQWLNSDAAAGSVWAPTNIFDRPPSWATNTGGFMRGLPADFLEAVQAAIVPCRTNSIFEVNSLDGTGFAVNQVYTLSDKFFLLSRPEIYGTWDSSTYKDGELLEYYNGLTDTERIKRDEAGSARNAWLRSPNPGYANNERLVYTSGSVTNLGADSAYGVAAACIIA